MNPDARFLVILVLASVVLPLNGCSPEPPAETTTSTTSDAAADATTDTAVNSKGHSGVLHGVVTDTSGQTVAGAFGRLESVDGRLTL